MNGEKQVYACINNFSEWREPGAHACINKIDDTIAHANKLGTKKTNILIHISKLNFYVCHIASYDKIFGKIRSHLTIFNLDVILRIFYFN